MECPIYRKRKFFHHLNFAESLTSIHKFIETQSRRAIGRFPDPVVSLILSSPLTKPQNPNLHPQPKNEQQLFLSSASQFFFYPTTLLFFLSFLSSLRSRLARTLESSIIFYGIETFNFAIKALLVGEGESHSQKL